MEVGTLLIRKDTSADKKVAKGTLAVITGKLGGLLTVANFTKSGKVIVSTTTAAFYYQAADQSTNPFEQCSRCNGVGKHSYCPSHGDKCFKCGGAGWTSKP